MKKTLLSLFAVVGFAFAANAAEPTVVDFSTATAFQGAENVKDTIGGIEFTFITPNAYVYDGSKYSQGVYVMLKNATPRGAMSFSLPFDCSKIVLTTTSGCSTNAGNKLTLSAGTAKVEELAVNKTNTDFTFSLEGTQRTKGTVYKFEATGSKNSQIAKLTFYPVSADPSVSIEEKSLTFATGLNGEQTLTFKVGAENITGNLTVSSDNAAFTVAAATVSVADAANGVEVTFKGTSTDVVKGNIKVEAGSASATIPVEGFAVAHAGTETDPLTVSDVLKMANLNNGEFCVTGVIGALTAANAKDGMVTEIADAKDNANSNIILKEGEKMIGVALPAASRDQLNIKDNPSNVGRTVVVKGTLENYYGAPGVKNTVYVSGLDSDGVEAIEAVDANAPVEYFNLQGVRVANPENGLFIRRQGSKVAKVLVK